MRLEGGKARGQATRRQTGARPAVVGGGLWPRMGSRHGAQLLRNRMMPVGLHRQTCGDPGQASGCKLLREGTVRP